MPPAAVQLSRIASFIGVKTAEVEKTGGDPRHEARAAGIPLMEGKLPDDPDIEFLNESIGLGQGLNSATG